MKANSRFFAGAKNHNLFLVTIIQGGPSIKELDRVGHFYFFCGVGDNGQQRINALTITSVYAINLNPILESPRYWFIEQNPSVL